MLIKNISTVYLCKHKDDPHDPATIYGWFFCTSKPKKTADFWEGHNWDYVLKAIPRETLPEAVVRELDRTGTKKLMEFQLHLL